MKLFSCNQSKLHIYCCPNAIIIYEYSLSLSRAYPAVSTMRGTMTITTFKPTKQHRNALGQEVEKDKRQTCGASIERNA